MIRIGIVGCGRILAAHLRGYRLLRAAGIVDFQITALCARRADDALGYIRRGGATPQRLPVSQIEGDPLSVGDEFLSDFQDDVEVAVYTDYRRMIAEAPIDAVNDFSTHALHHQVAAAAFAAGKHLLTQKPLAVTVAAARAMCDEADARGLTFGVFESARQSPATRHLRWLFESGYAGPLQMVVLGYLAAWWAPDRIVAETPWRHRRDEGGGISLDLGVHFFDQIRSVAGEIESVQARTAVIEPRRATRSHDGQVLAEIDCDADDTFFAQAVTRSGVLCNLAASWAGHGGRTLTGSGTVWYGSRGRADAGTLTTDDGTLHHLETLYNQHAPAERHECEFPLGLSDSFALAQLDWLDAIRHRRQPETSGREGLLDLAAAYAILESATAGRQVQVAEVLDAALDQYQRPINAKFGISDR